MAMYAACDGAPDRRDAGRRLNRCGPPRPRPWLGVAGYVPFAAFGALAACVTFGASGAEAPALPVAAAQPATVVRFAPEADYGPFVFRAEDGSIQGLSMDLLRRLAPATGWQLEVLPARPLAEQLAAAQRGEVDLLSSLRPTTERAAYLGFTSPYLVVPAVLVRRAGPGSDDLSAYTGQPVAVGAGYAVQAHVQAAHPRVRWLAVPDDARALRLLSEGQVAGAVMDVASARFLMRRLGLPGLQLGPPVGFDYPLSFAWRRDRPELGATLERALAELPLAERDALVERWMAGGLAEAPDSHRQRLARAGVVAVLLGAGLWSWLHWRRRRRARPELPR